MNVLKAASPVNPAYVVALLVVLVAAGIYWWGGRGARQEVQQQSATIKDMGNDAQARADTSTRVAEDQAATTEWAMAAQGRIHERIIEQPAAPVPASSYPAGADVLRVSREAYERALCARERVQRDHACPETAAAAR